MGDGDAEVDGDADADNDGDDKEKANEIKQGEGDHQKAAMWLQFRRNDLATIQLLYIRGFPQQLHELGASLVKELSRQIAKPRVKDVNVARR